MKNPNYESMVDFCYTAESPEDVLRQIQSLIRYFEYITPVALAEWHRTHPNKTKINYTKEGF